MPDHVMLARNHPANGGHQPGGNRTPRLGTQTFMHRTPKGRNVLCLPVEPIHRLLDDLQRQLVAVAGIIRPGEKPVAFQNNALRFRVFKTIVLQPEAQLIPRSLPRQPADVLAENLFGQRPRILRGRDRNDRIGVHVIHMFARHIGMQRRVDAGRARVQVEGAMGQEADHLILHLHPLIDALQGAQLVHVKRGKPVHLDRAHIPAGPFDPQDLHRVPGQRIGFDHLGRGIAAAIIRDPLVRPQKIRAVQQLIRLAHLAGLCGIPLINKAI